MKHDKQTLNLILKTARRLIERGSEEYICHALDILYREAIHDEIRFIKDTIRNRLGDVYSYEAWAIENCPEFDVTNKKHIAMVKQGRLNWVDSLIEEFAI